MDEDAGPPNRELYALLHISPQASDEEIRRAYRQWAQVYHPDKYKAPQMKDIASENFHRIREAYEILSDKNKRQIYDIYGMEGLKSGLELGAKLNRVEEIKEEIERLKRKEAQEKALNHFRPSGSILASLSLPQYLGGDGVMTGMAMASEVHSHISKRNAISISGNLSVRGNSGGGAATAVLEHQISSASSIDFVASAGLRSLIGVQSSRNLSHHSTATVGVARSLKDGSITLSNAWTRQLSEASSGDIQLVLGPESFVSVGWKKQDEKVSAAGELKFGTSSFGASAHYTHRLSSKSSGCVSGRFGSTNLEFEVGVARRISDFSTLLMLYTIGIEGVGWKFELHHGGQKLIIPVLLSGHVKAGFAAGAFFIPTSFYFLLKKYIFKPYYLRQEKQKALENREKTSAQVKEARTAADKAQQLLRDVANRKRNKQQEAGGLVVTNAVYGSCKALKKRDETSNPNDVLASQVIDVTLPLNFLVNDSGELKLHKGIKKSGIMGFCDCCPGEPKQLYVEYMYKVNRYEVMVDDYEELRLPQEELMI